MSQAQNQNLDPVLHEEVIDSITAHIEDLKNMPLFKKLSDKKKSEWLSNLENLKLHAQNHNWEEMWECCVDHMFNTDWEFDIGPQSWQLMYEKVDELRTEMGVESIS